MTMDICDELEAKASTVHGGAYAVMHKARKEIAALRVALEQTQKDAARYRWLRTFRVDSYRAGGMLNQLDAEIDAAMSDAPGA